MKVWTWQIKRRCGQNHQRGVTLGTAGILGIPHLMVDLDPRLLSSYFRYDPDATESGTPLALFEGDKNSLSILCLWCSPPAPRGLDLLAASVALATLDRQSRPFAGHGAGPEKSNGRPGVSLRSCHHRLPACAGCTAGQCTCGVCERLLIPVQTEFLFKGLEQCFTPYGWCCAHVRKSSPI